MLYRQAPDVQIIADHPNDIDYEAAIDSERGADAQEDKCNLIHVWA